MLRPWAHAAGQVTSKTMVRYPNLHRSLDEASIIALNQLNVHHAYARYLSMPHTSASPHIYNALTSTGCADTVMKLNKYPVCKFLLLPCTSSKRVDGRMTMSEVQPSSHCFPQQCADHQADTIQTTSNIISVCIFQWTSQCHAIPNRKLMKIKLFKAAILINFNT